MPRTTQMFETEQIKELQQQLIEAKKQARRQKIVEEAQRTIEELGKEYEHSKHVFFAVNGARRVLKQN